MQHILAVSGVKNSGKTTLIGRMIPVFRKRGLKVAVIKHDGHEFEADVPGTDSWKHKQAGAYGTAVFSSSRYMIVKEEPGVSFWKLADCFPEADLILLEGGKTLELPRIEVVRGEISREPVCAPEHTAAYVTDLPVSRPWMESGIPVFGFGQTEELCTYVLKIIIKNDKIAL